MKYLIIAKPNAQKELVEQVDEHTFRVWVKAKPVENQANREIIRLVAEYLDADIDSFYFMAGRTSKYKYLIQERD